MAKQPRIKILAVTILGLVTGVVGYNAISTPDRRTADQKFGAAVYDLSYGVDDAPQPLKYGAPDEKLDNIVLDTTSDFKNLPAKRPAY